MRTISIVEMETIGNSEAYRSLPRPILINEWQTKWKGMQIMRFFIYHQIGFWSPFCFVYN